MPNGKVFVGAWIDDSTKRRFKMACAAHEINQQDIIEVLIENWLKKPIVKDEMKKLVKDGKKKNRAG